MKSIKSKLILYILLITTIPVIAFLVYSFVFVSSDVIASEVDTNETKLEWATQYIDLVNEQIDDIVYSIHVKESLLSQVDNAFTDSNEIEQLIKDVLYTNSNLLARVEVLSANSYRSVSFDYENGFKTEILEYNDYFFEVSNEPMGIEYINYNNDIYIVHTINDFETQALLGVIVLKLNSAVKEKLDDIFGNDVEYAVFSDKSTIYNDSDFDITLLDKYTNEINYGIKNVELGDTMSWINKTSRTELYIVSLVDTDIINQYSNNLVLMGIIIVGLSIVVAVPIAILLSSNITKPIIDLTEHMKKSNLKQIENISNNYDEIAILENGYNNMVSEITLLISEKYQQEISRQQAQLKALQAQINPHFLANTFQLIGGMAMSHNAPDIYDATIKMSNLIRYAMKLNNDTTTLEEEILYMKDYLDIQKLRFGDNLVFDTKISTDVKGIKIPKLTIQPIIENSFKHGLKKQRGVWNISIKSKVTDEVYIYITDNGKGISEDKLELINSQFVYQDDYLNKDYNSELSSIGLANIDSRIKLLFGRHYGLKLSNNANTGVTVCIKLPKGDKIK